MATTTVKAFLAAKQTQVAALMNGGSKLFNSVWVGPTLDIEKTLTVNRCPMALLSDFGGSLQRPNGKIWDRRFSVTAIVSRPRDFVGQKAAFDLLEIGDVLVPALTNDRTDSAVFCYAESEELMLPTETGTQFFAKSWHFQYCIEIA
ncbi:MAG: hypothetical protein BroJett007_33980 [Chloroflexota bacterium]|nr:MAG: hypothetical protein BroJett007_33980 [Chloroflexota bacterium]